MCEDSIMSFGKYRGKKLSQILDEDKNYVRWILENVEPSTPDRKNTLLFFKEMYPTSEEALKGSLTTRIKQIQEFRLGGGILDFFGIDKKTAVITTPIPVSENFKKIISLFREKSPALCGIYVDYLVRFLISKDRNEVFYDSRCEEIIAKGSSPFLDKIPDIAFSYNFLRTSNQRYDLEISAPCVYSVSLAHSLFFGRLPEECLSFVSIFNEIEFSSFLKELETIVSDYVTSQYRVVECNPHYTYNSLSGDPDIVTDKSVIDIKVTSKPMSEYEILQLLSYRALLLCSGDTREISEVATLNLCECCLSKIEIGNIPTLKFQKLGEYLDNGGEVGVNNNILLKSDSPSSPIEKKWEGIKSKVWTTLLGYKNYFSRNVWIGVGLTLSFGIGYYISQR